MSETCRILTTWKPIRFLETRSPTYLKEDLRGPSHKSEKKTSVSTSRTIKTSDMNYFKKLKVRFVLEKVSDGVYVVQGCLPGIVFLLGSKIFDELECIGHIQVGISVNNKRQAGDLIFKNIVNVCTLPSQTCHQWAELLFLQELPFKKWLKFKIKCIESMHGVPYTVIQTKLFDKILSVFLVVQNSVIELLVGVQNVPVTSNSTDIYKSTFISNYKSLWILLLYISAIISVQAASLVSLTWIQWVGRPFQFPKSLLSPTKVIGISHEWL